MLHDCIHNVASCTYVRIVVPIAGPLQLCAGIVVCIAGPLQLCAGQDGGCEPAVHAMRSIFQAPETEAVLLVDANNAFNLLNRKAALHNISIICPSLARTLINTYRAPVRLFITSSGEISSTEGTTQGPGNGHVCLSHSPTH